tara:strand:- start:683 stop:1687 length:1005 start_codon:yes stop_codon:yes gene_type:complete
MSPIQKCILNKDKSYKPIWIMRQAGRYLPEFRKIREKNKNFVKLCLNKNLIPEITLQPIKRFDFDAAIIFSDILIVPYGLGQKLEFTKGLGPKLGKFDETNISKININNYINKLKPVYDSISITSKNSILKNKDLIGFIGAPWTLLVYMINQSSPKKKLKDSFFKNRKLIKNIIGVLIKYLKIHISHQVKSGATIIQIFDSWAGLVKDKDLKKYIYDPTKEIVDFTKTLGVPVICFPRNIKNYKEFISEVGPDVISIDHNVNPEKIRQDITIPVQGGLDPRILLKSKSLLKKNTKKYLDLFKDHPYIFNLGHGVLPETDPNMLEYLIKFVKDNQ